MRDFSFQDQKFEVREVEFQLGERKYSFERVAHLLFGEVQTTHRTNYIKTGEYLEAVLIITLDDGYQIRIAYDEAGLFYNVFLKKNLSQQIRRLREAFEHLATKTFQQRLNSYVDQLEKNGYFVIDECKFYPPKEVHFRNKVFLVKATTFVRHPGYILLEPRKQTLLDVVSSNLTLAKIPQFNIQTDTDVCFFLLEKTFGISWKGKS